MKRVLITGGAGFIGQAVAPMLISRGWDVTVLDNLSPQIHGAHPDISRLERTLIGARLVIGDVQDRDLLERCLHAQDAVLHLAAETGTGQSMYEIRRYVEANVGGTANFLDLIVNADRKPTRVVVASSRAIYGEGAARCPKHGCVFPDDRRSSDMSRGVFSTICPICGEFCSCLATPEHAPLRPSSIYGQTKLSQEQLTLIACASAGVPALALRYQNVFGPGQSLRNPYTGILSIFSTAILSGADIRVFEDGDESRDFVYVEDVARATCMALEATPDKVGAVNIGSGKAITVSTVVQALMRLYASEVSVAVTGEFRKGDIRHGVADTENAKKVLGFDAEWTFERGLEQFAAWVKTQQIERSNYAESLDEMRTRNLLSRQ